MVRAQIYLEEEHQQLLHQASNESGESMSSLIRTAINSYFQTKPTQNTDKITQLKALKGIWKDADPLEFEKIRNEFNRHE